MKEKESVTPYSAYYYFYLRLRDKYGPETEIQFKDLKKEIGNNLKLPADLKQVCIEEMEGFGLVEINKNGKVIIKNKSQERLEKELKQRTKKRFK